MGRFSAEGGFEEACEDVIIRVYLSLGRVAEDGHPSHGAKEALAVVDDVIFVDRRFEGEELHR